MKNGIVKINAPGGFTRLQKKRHRMMNYFMIDNCKKYRNRFKIVKFRNWISKVQSCMLHTTSNCSCVHFKCSLILLPLDE